MEEYKKIVPVQFVADKDSLKTLEMQVEGVVKGIKIDVDLPTKTNIKSLKTSDSTEEKETQDSIASILQAQYESYSRIQEMKRHSSRYTQEDIENEQQVLETLKQQTAELGTDGQLEILDEKRKLAAQILELSQLDTKESKAKTKELMNQLKYLDKNFKVEDTGAKGSIKGSMMNVARSLNLTSFIQTLSVFKLGLVAGLVNVGAQFISSMKDMFKDAISDGQQAIGDLLDASRMSSASTRQTMFTWGFNQEQAYGYNQAMSAMGWNSFEDYMYGTDTERNQFYSVMTDFANQYAQLEQSGFFDNLLDQQIGQYELDQEKKIADAEFYKENFEYLKTIQEVQLEWREFWMDLLKPVLQLFHKSEVKADSAKADEVLSAYSNNATSFDQRKTYTISLNNSFDVKDNANSKRIADDLYNQVLMGIQ